MAFIRALYIAALALLSQVFAFGTDVGVQGFLIPSILMGLGVAIDVALATIAKFNDESMSWKSWTIPVTLTHTIFPAIGYFLFWSAASSFPTIKIFLGITGFILVALFIYEVVCESIDTKPIFGISEQVGKLFGFSHNDARITVAILAVSWDALWSGPAKATQATVGNWTTGEVFLSFLIAGLVVAVVAELALFISYLLRKQHFSNPTSFSLFTIVSKYIELSVIGAFGVLSLLHAFTDDISIYTSILISSILMLFVFVLVRNRQWKVQLADSKEVLV